MQIGRPSSHVDTSFFFFFLFPFLGMECIHCNSVSLFFHIQILCAMGGWYGRTIQAYLVSNYFSHHLRFPKLDMSGGGNWVQSVHVVYKALHATAMECSVYRLFVVYLKPFKFLMPHILQKTLIGRLIKSYMYHDPLKRKITRNILKKKKIIFDKSQTCPLIRSYSSQQN